MQTRLLVLFIVFIFNTILFAVKGIEVVSDILFISVSLYYLFYFSYFSKIIKSITK